MGAQASVAESASASRQLVDVSNLGALSRKLHRLVLFVLVCPVISGLALLAPKGPLVLAPAPCITAGLAALVVWIGAFLLMHGRISLLPTLGAVAGGLIVVAVGGLISRRSLGPQIALVLAVVVALQTRSYWRACVRAQVPSWRPVRANRAVPAVRLPRRRQRPIGAKALLAIVEAVVGAAIGAVMFAFAIFNTVFLPAILFDPVGRVLGSAYRACLRSLQAASTRLGAEPDPPIFVVRASKGHEPRISVPSNALLRGTIGPDRPRFGDFFAEQLSLYGAPSDASAKAVAHRRCAIGDDPGAPLLGGRTVVVILEDEAGHDPLAADAAIADNFILVFPTNASALSNDNGSSITKHLRGVAAVPDFNRLAEVLMIVISKGDHAIWITGEGRTYWDYVAALDEAMTISGLQESPNLTPGALERWATGGQAIDRHIDWSIHSPASPSALAARASTVIEGARGYTVTREDSAVIVNETYTPGWAVAVAVLGLPLILPLGFLLIKKNKKTLAVTFTPVQGETLVKIAGVAAEPVVARLLAALSVSPGAAGLMEARP